LNSLVLLEKADARPRLNGLLQHSHPEMRAAASRQLLRLEKLP
jgi:hypothetical protein